MGRMLQEGLCPLNRLKLECVALVGYHDTYDVSWENSYLKLSNCFKNPCLKFPYIICYNECEKQQIMNAENNKEHTYLT